MKRFLDSLAYFYMSGFRDGIETDYKRVMYSKREVPDSSCPSFVQNLLYGAGSVSPGAAREEADRFEVIMERLDQAAEKYEASQRQAHTETRYEKMQRLGLNGGVWCRVDTDGVFRIGFHAYKISDQAVQYQPVETEYGDYYAMDRVLVHNGRVYDMNLEEVEVLLAGDARTQAGPDRAQEIINGTSV